MCTHPLLKFLLLAAAMSAMAGPAAADELPPRITPELEVRLTAGVWLARLGGNARLDNGSNSRLELKEDLGLRDMEAVFNAELNISKHEFFDLHLSGFSFSTDSSSSFSGSGAFGDVQFADGDPYRASFDLTSVSGELRLALYRPFHNSDQKFNSDGRRRVKFHCGPSVGARYINVDQRVEHVGVSRADAGGEWFAFTGGAHFALMFRPDGDFPFVDRFGLDAAVSVGPLMGGDGGIAWNVQSTFRMYFTDNFSLHVGYRLCEMNAKNDGYEFRGGLQGLFLGGSLYF